MKSVKKIIALTILTSMVLANFITVNASTIVDGIHRPGLFDSVADNNDTDIKNTTTSVSGTDAKLVTSSHSSGTWAYIKYRNTMGTSGTHSLDLNAGGSTNYDRDNGGAMVRFVFGQSSADGKYHVSFNLTTFGTSTSDYATLNWDSWDGAAKLYSGSKWKKTEIGTGASNGGIGDQVWTKYEADFTSSSTSDLELRIAVYSWARIAIDDILITDGSGNILFSEDFERGEVLSTLLTRWKYGGTTGAVKFKIMSDKENPSNHILNVTGTNTGAGRYCLDVPKTADNIYEVTFTKKQLNGHIYNPVSLGFSNNEYGDGNLAKSITTEAGSQTITLNSAGNTQFRINSGGWGAVVLDDICIKNSKGEILVYEDFEDTNREISYPFLKKNGSQISSVESGTLNISTSVRNNYESTPFTAYVIVAVYNSDETEVNKVVFKNATLSKGQELNFNEDISISQNDNKIKVFWWGNMTDINALKNSVIYTK